MLNLNSITEITTQAFAQTGPLSKLVKNYVPNTIQIQYAEKVAQVFAHGSARETSIGILEAGTGIGKTLAYAIPLLAYASLSGKRVAISTYTIQLQSQMLSAGGDIDIAQQVIFELTGKRLIIAPRLGLRNFVSPLRIRTAMAEKNIANANSPESVKKFLNWAEASKSGLLMEWNWLYGEIPSEFLISEVCCEQYLPAAEKLRYESHKELAKSADVLITNHTLTLMHAVSGNRSILDDSDSRALSIIVADEADRIDDAANLIVNNSSSLISIRSLFSRHADPYSADILNSVQAISNLARKLDTERSSHINLHNKPGAASEIQLHISKILPLLNNSLALCTDPETGAEISLYRKLLAAFTKNLSQGSTPTTPVIHYSDVKRYPSLRMVNPAPGTSFGWLWYDDTKKNIKSYLDAGLLTSATLSDGNEASLKSFALSTGLFLSQNHQLTTGIFEPTDFGKISMVLPHVDAPIPTKALGKDEFSTNPDWIVYITEMILEAATSGERVLVLTLSYRDTRMIADKLRSLRPRITTLIQHTESVPIQEMLNRFKNTESAICFHRPAGKGLICRAW